MSIRIALAADNTVALHFPSVIDFVKRHSSNIACTLLGYRPRFNKDELEFDQEYPAVKTALLKETSEYDLIVIVTMIPFTNNYFYTGLQPIIILSLSGWHHLTTLPMSNGLVYKLCQMITEIVMNIGVVHEETTGCVNDFLWNKKGIDVGMRAAFICQECRVHSASNPHLKSEDFADLTKILNAVSVASRIDMDILSYQVESNDSKVTPMYDAFLCHNSEDKQDVRWLNERFKSKGLKTWFDEDQLRPGDVWQDELEKVISQINCCMILVGSSGFGPWQDIEKRTFINEFANRGCRIIPVIIGKIDVFPKLPLFLKQFMWSDLRDRNEVQLDRIATVLREKS